MKNRDIKKMTKDQLIKDLDKYKKDLFNLRFQKVNGQLTDVSKFKLSKRTIARIKTTIKNKQYVKKNFNWKSD